MEAKGSSVMKVLRQDNLGKFCSKSQQHIKDEKYLKNEEKSENIV